MEKSEITRNILSDITVYNKYAKYVANVKRRENWGEIVYRYIDMMVKKYPQLEQEIYDNSILIMDKKVFPSMRGLQFAGKAVDIAPNRLYNCSFRAIDSLDAFSEIMFLLLGGSGVGYSVQKHHINKLPELKGKLKNKRNRRYLISDSIEGWADAIKVLTEVYFNNKRDVTFDYSDIRPKGSRLVTAGGKAPGPQPLKDCIHNIRKVLDTAIEERGVATKIKPIEAHDIACYIADAVLAGGIRRSAMVSLFSYSDNEMMNCKSGNWYELNPQRGRANNSVVLLRHRLKKKDFDNIFNRIELSRAGEPGFFLTNDKELGSNPCFTSDMKLKTKDGFKSFGELNGSNHILIGEDGKEYDGKVWSNGIKFVIQLKDSVGRIYKCTPNHIFKLIDGSECKAKNLRGKTLKNFNKNESISKIISIKDIGEEEVFDFNIQNEEHWGVVSHSNDENSGVIVHNCMEISLKSSQFCNLTTIDVSDIDSQDELNKRAKVATFFGTLQSGFVDFHYLGDEWRQNCEDDSLLGVSMTGIASGTVMKYDIKEASKLTVEENKRVAEIININPSNRICCVKPEGTVSLVAGTSSGIHAWHSKYYIRRMSLNKDEALYKYLKKAIPALVEDSVFEPNKTAYLIIPIKAPKGSILRSESEIDILERVKFFNENWIKPSHIKGSNTHNVSCTINIKDGNWNTVKEWMWENRDYYTGISLFPYDSGSYVQTPFEECTKERYEELLTHARNINLDKVIEEEDNVDLKMELACAGGGCEVQ